MNRPRRPLRAALSALLVFALSTPAWGQDQPLPSEEPAPPPAPRAKPARAPAAPRPTTPEAAPAPAAPRREAAPEEAPAAPEPAPAAEEAAPAEAAAEPADEEGGPRGSSHPPPVAAGASARAEPLPDSDEEVPAPVPSRRRPAPSPDDEVEAVVVVSYGPRVLSYEEGDSIPDGYAKDRRTRTGLVIAGAVTLGLSWLASCGAAGYVIWNKRKDQDPVVAGFGDVPGEAALAIPLAGPFIAIDTADPNPAGMALLVADGVIQVGALAMLITGLAAKETVLVRTESTEVALLPSGGPGQGGMALSGTF